MYLSNTGTGRDETTAKPVIGTGSFQKRMNYSGLIMVRDSEKLKKRYPA